MLNRALLCAAYVIAGIISLVWLTLSHASAAPEFPALTGRVVDEAGVLSDETKAQLISMLAGDEQKFGGRQVVVVTLKSLQGYTIEEYGVDLGRAWHIGQKGKDDGTLLIVAPSERKARIEVGYGLEGTLTDARSRIIIERYMKPSFRKGDYNAGILAGTKAVLQTLGNQTLAPPPQVQSDDEDDDTAPSIGFIIFIVVMLLLFHGGRMFWPLFFLGGFGGGRGGWGGGGGGFGGGGGGGGFSGGGGSFGGGGASGSW